MCIMMKIIFPFLGCQPFLEPRETEREREHCHSGIVNSLINRCTVSARCREGGVVRSPKTKYPLAVILVPGATQFSGQIWLGWNFYGHALLDLTTYFRPIPSSF